MEADWAKLKQIEEINEIIKDPVFPGSQEQGVQGSMSHFKHLLSFLFFHRSQMIFKLNLNTQSCLYGFWNIKMYQIQVLLL